MYENYRPPQANSLPPVVKNLIILNVILFLGKEAFMRAQGLDLTDHLGQHYFLADKFRIWQPVTSMFMHFDIAHIVLNMLGLYIFGSILERYWGPKKFLAFYFVCGLGASATDFTVNYFRMDSALQPVNEYIQAPSVAKFEKLLQGKEVVIYQEMSENYMIMANKYNNLLNEGKTTQATELSVSYMEDYKQEFMDIPVSIGASGAIYGLLLAFAIIFPNVKLLLYFFIPIRAWIAVTLFGIIELGSAFAQFKGDNVGHVAHLGGMLFGLIMILYWKKRDKRIFH